MKLLTAMMLAALTLPFGANAFAQTTTPELTRADVRAQLIEAQREGLVPSNKDNYPPTAQQIARNREIYAIQHGQDVATASQTSPFGTSPSSSN